MNLTARERLLLSAAACILLPLFLFRLTILPFWEYQDQLQLDKIKLQREIQLIKEKGREFQKIQRSNLSGGQPLSRTVNRILTSLGLDSAAEQSSRTVQSGEGMALKLQNITLYDATSLIARLEKTVPSIVIESLDMKQSPSNQNLLQVILSISSGGK